jgi:hypothetical protein
VILLDLLLTPFAFLLGSIPDRWIDRDLHRIRARIFYAECVESVGDIFLGYVDGPPERLRDFAARKGLI